MTDAKEETGLVKSPAEKAIAEALTSGLILLDRMKLPPNGARAACATNAEAELIYAPWHRDMCGYMMNAVIAHMLIRVTEQSPRLANEIAHEVAEWSEAGDVYPEWLWEWATDRGIDPDTLKAKNKADYAEWLAAAPIRVGSVKP